MSSRIGSILAMPNQYTRYATVKDENGRNFTVEPIEIPKDAEVGKDVAFKVELYGGDGGLAYDIQED